MPGSAPNRGSRIPSASAWTASKPGPVGCGDPRAPSDGSSPNARRASPCSPFRAGPGGVRCCRPRRSFPPRTPPTRARSRTPAANCTSTPPPGASARIYGHGNARRWAWLHADLGYGDVLEIVAAVSMRPGLNKLPPLTFLRLRRNGRTWPRRSERGAVGWAGLGRFRTRIGLPVWTVSGTAGLRRIRVEVTQPLERTLALDYTDPDGGAAVCRNSESADARVLLERWWGRWRTEAEWFLDGTAHAEVGDR